MDHKLVEFYAHKLGCFTLWEMERIIGEQIRLNTTRWFMPSK